MTEPTGQGPAREGPAVPAGPTTAAPERPPAAPWGFLDVLAVFALTWLLVALLRPLLSAAMADLALDGLVDALFLLVGTAAMAVATVGYVAARFGSRSARRLAGDGRWSVGVLVAGALHGVVALVFNLVVGFVVARLAERAGAELPQPQEALREVLADPSAVLLVAAVLIIVTPLAEELFFRGMLFQALWQRLGRWPGIGLSGLLFGLAHVFGHSLVSALYVLVILFPVGMYMAWVFSRHRHLSVTVAMHAAYNSLATVAIVGGWF